MFKELFSSVFGTPKPPQQQPIFKIKKDDKDRIRIKNNLLATANIPSKLGQTALHAAVQEGMNANLSAIDELCQLKELDINKKDDFGNTALQIAACQCHSDVVKRILNSRAAIQCQTDNGLTALHSAVMANKADNVTALLDYNADATIATTNSRSVCKGSTPLHSVFNLFDEPSVEILSALLTQPNAINQPDDTQQTPLHYAMAHKNIDACGERNLATLLSHGDFGATTNQQITPLHRAAGNKNMSAKTFGCVVSHCSEALLNQLDKSGRTPLVTALINNDQEKVNMLLLLRVDVNLHATKMSPLIRAIRNNDLDSVVIMLYQNANIREKDKNGLGPLVHAAEIGNVQIIQRLKNYGSKFDGLQGELAVKKALLNNNIDALIKLIELGANPNVHVYPQRSNSKWNDFSTSSIKPVEEEIDKTMQLARGDTPLHFAVKTGNKKLAALCLRANPDLVNVANAKGDTPAHYAIDYAFESPGMGFLLTSLSTGINISAPYDNQEGKENTLLAHAEACCLSSEDLINFFTDPEFKLPATAKKKHSEPPVEFNISASKVVMFPVKVGSVELDALDACMTYPSNSC